MPLRPPIYEQITRTRFRDGAGWATHHLSNGIVISLAWSTTITSIIIFVWLLAFFLALNLQCLRRQVFTAAGALPLLLVAWALLGIFWATNLTWAESFTGLREFHKLLFIPLWLAYFSQSRHGSSPV